MFSMAIIVDVQSAKMRSQSVTLLHQSAICKVIRRTPAQT